MLGDPARRRAYDTRHTTGRFAGPGGGGPRAIVVEGAGPVHHLDLGHHSDFYRSGDPLSHDGYLVRRRDLERPDRTAGRRKPKPGGGPELEDDVLATAES